MIAGLMVNYFITDVELEGYNRVFNLWARLLAAGIRAPENVSHPVMCPTSHKT